MQKVLIQGLSIERLSLIRETLEANFPYPSYCAVTAKEALDLQSRHMFHLFIFEVAYFSMEHFETLKLYRSKGLSAPALIMADSVQSPLFFENAEQFKMHWLSVPHTEKEFVGLTRKLMTAKKAPQQMFRRFRTNQTAALEPLMGSEAVQSEMYNLSKGGAYCEYDGPNLLPVGEMVRVRIPLKDVKRDHILNARVIWNTKKGRYSGRSGLGLKFVKPNEVHRYLMEKL